MKDEIAALTQAVEHLNRAVDCLSTRDRLVRERTGSTPFNRLGFYELRLAKLRINNEIDRLRAKAEKTA